MTTTRMNANVARARAGLVATEQGLLGLSAGMCVAVALLTWVAPSAPERLVVMATWVAVGMLVTGAAVSVSGRVLDIGEFSRQPAAMNAFFGPLLGSVGLAALSLTLLLFAPGIGSPLGKTSLQLAALSGIGVMSVLSLRSSLITTTVSVFLLSAISQPIGHALLGGLATLLLIGLLIGEMTAQVTYRLGIATAALAAATIATTAICVRRARAALDAARKTGGRFPLAEQAYRLAVGATVLGLLLPAIIVIADLLAARLTLLLLAAAAMAVSNHALRFALVMCDLSLANAAPSRSRSTNEFDSTRLPL